MSVMGVSANLLSSLYANQSTQNSQNNQNNFQQIQTEFQQLGQDLQTGNLSQAQQDFATLSQNFPAAQQASTNSAGGATNTSPLAQAFSALGQALQSGNISAAQSAFTNVQQDVQQSASQPHSHHHHHFGGASQNGQTNSVSQAFQSLSQALQSDNLSAAQTAFATLQQDIGQGSFGSYGSPASSATDGASSGSGLNVTA